MDQNELHYEEYPLLPEHSVPPEYTPEYPDVSFFQESYVTAREENIFQGETPPGEEDPNVIRREKQKKRSRFAWLQNLLGSALRGGAILLALLGLISVLTSETEAAPDTPAGQVKEYYTALRKPPFRHPDDYGPEELLSLWLGEPEGPHQYDFEHAHVRREASCQEDGILEYLCTECGIALQETIPGGHVPAAAVRENERAAGCTENGGYDTVVYCSICQEELSREHTVYQATGHSAGETVIENVIGAICTEGGSYEEVVYCSVCHSELSRETVETLAPGHVPAEAVLENEIASTCTEAGSADSVVYCSICGAEVSRETLVLPLAAHVEAPEVEENRVEPTCTEEGSAELAVYCEVCGEELSRETVVLEASGHTEAEAVLENETEASCTEEGGYDEVVYCEVCGEEISREHTVIEATGHDWGEPVYTWSSDSSSITATRTCRNDPSHMETETATAGSTVTAQATCTAAGSRSYTASFSNPAFAAQTKNVTVPATGHNWGEPVYNWSSDNGKVTATRTCRNDSSHKETETVNTTNAVTTQPGCTTAGTRTYTASFSNSAFTKQTKPTTIAALGHSYTDKTTAPTCTAQGYTTHTCSRCGNSYKDNYTSALGHSPDDSNMENYHAATCLTDGYYDVITRCTVCNTVLSSQRYDIAAHGHTFNVNNGGELRCSNSDCNTAGGAPAVTLSYIKSNNTFYMTMNSDFVKVLDGSKTIKYRVEGALKGTTRYTYCHNDDRYWTTDGTTFRQSVNVEADLLPYAFDSGDTVVCRLVLQYILGTNAIYIYSPEIEITIP